MNSINIVKQLSPSCQGQHVDPEYTLLSGAWTRTDPKGRGPVVESVSRQENEDDQGFYARVDSRASELDRELRCSRCYR